MPVAFNKCPKPKQHGTKTLGHGCFAALVWSDKNIDAICEGKVRLTTILPKPAKLQPFENQLRHPIALP